MALGLLAASPAPAAWSREKVATGAADFGDVALAGNERGDAALLFKTSNGLALALARPGRDFGSARAMPRVGDEQSAGVAVDERGNVLVVWTYNDHSAPPPPSDLRSDDCCVRIRVAFLPAGGKRLSGPITVGPRGVDAYLGGFSIVNGRVGVAWRDPDGIAARFSRRGLKLGSAIRTPGNNALYAIPLRTGPVVTFERFDELPDGSNFEWSVWQLKVRSGRPRLLRRVLGGRNELPGIGVSANAHGEHVLAWTQENDVHSYNVSAGVISPGGALSSRRIVGNASYGDPTVAIARTGAAVAGWDNGAQAFVASRRPGGAFAGGRLVGPAARNGYVTDVTLAVDAAARAVVGWRQESPGRSEKQRVAFRTPGGRRVGLHEFSTTSSFTERPTVTLDGHGVGRIAWVRGGVMYAARARFPGR